jgi:Tfp pilus assembly protein PilF
MIKLKNINYNYSATCLVLVFILLIIGAAFYPTGWNWGLHFLSFYGTEIIIIVPFLMLLFTFGAVQGFFIKRISSIGLWFHKQPRALRIIFTLAALSGFVLLFWIFRVKSYFLGDGQLMLRNIQNLNSVDELASNYKREPLIGLCIVLLTNFFIVIKRLNPTLDAYTWLSILSGIIFIIAAWKFVKYYADDQIEQFMLFILLVFTGVSQLFFGYVENYSPSAAGILLFLLYGVLFLKGRTSVTWVIFIYGITFIFHFGTLIFLPALAFLLYIAVRRKQMKELAISLFLTSVIVFSLLHLTLYPLELLKNVLGGTGRHIVAFSSQINKYQAYDFFSISHIIDVGNFLFLCYPAVSILLIFSGFLIWRNHKILTIEAKLLLLTALCGCVFTVIFNCEIGMSRDWDILAPISLGIPAAAIALWNTIEYDKKNRQRILLMLCIISPIHTGLWIGVNANEDKALKRFEMLEDRHLWSKHAYLSAYEELAVYHRDRGDYEKAIQYYQKYISLDSTNQRLWRNLAGIYQSTGQKRKAVEVYTTMLRFGMANYQDITNLGIHYIQDKRFTDAMVLFRRAEEDAPGDPVVKYNIGITIIESEKAYRKAIPYFLDAMRFDSAFSPAYYVAAECYSQLGDSIRARQLLIRLQNLSRDSNIR